MHGYFISDVYDTLLGTMEDDSLVPEVENCFAPGTKCDRLYRDIMDAYERLRNRLGAADEDMDVEIIINAFMDIQQELCIKMYQYGAKFGNHK